MQKVERTAIFAYKFVIICYSLQLKDGYVKVLGLSLEASMQLMKILLD